MLREPPHTDAEQVAQEFYSALSSLSPRYGYKSRTPTWEDTPPKFRELLVAVFSQLLRNNVLRKVQPRKTSAMPQQAAYPASETVKTGTAL